MAAPGFGTSPFILPNQFDSPGNALQQGLAMQERRNERQFELNWRLQRQKDADDWKKLQLIQELSDVDKYQTGEAVADALGNLKSSEILQKYTALAATLTPAELQGRISQDMQNTASGMQSMKDELVQSNKVLADLKSRFPSLDTKALDRHYRADVLTRRIEGNEFKNPIHVDPTNMRFDDPDFLAAFVTGDKATRDEIVNPKLVEKGVQVGMGSPSSYTMMKGDIPFFRKRNFDPDKDVVGGFLKKGINPKMEMKSTVEKLAGQDIELLDQDAFDVFSDNAKLEITAKAAKNVPGFYSLSKQDREKVKRRIALEDIQALDQSGFSFGSATKPPSIHVSTGGSGSGGGSGEIKGNEFDRIDYDAGGVQIKGGVATETQTGQPYSRGIRIMAKLLPAQVQAIMKAGGVDISEEEYFNLKYENGKLQTITPESSGKVIDRTDMANFQKKYNSEPQKGSQPYFGERDGSKKDNTQPQGTKQKKYKGLDAKGNPIFE